MQDRLFWLCLMQIKQPTLSTGIAMYTCTSCTLSNLVLPTTAGFGIYGEQ